MLAYTINHPPQENIHHHIAQVALHISVASDLSCTNDVSCCFPFFIHRPSSGTILTFIGLSPALCRNSCHMPNQYHMAEYLEAHQALVSKDLVDSEDED